MNVFDQRIENVINALQHLPGVGRKTATRMTLYLLQGHHEAAHELSDSIREALKGITLCEECRNLSDTDLCLMCTSSRRNNDTLCVVESSSDLVAIEETGNYNGKYFVLHGLLSPIEGLGPTELGLDLLGNVIRNRGVRELIMATNASVEGEVTVQYISEMPLPEGLIISRIAHGIPVGGELGYVNRRTISHAFLDRKQIEHRN